ncbi:MAG TPA: hypothetical protein DCQ36_00110 [Actinobacteria bacterium]|nr:hypothetical protein [Actinomycetota bacterium]
MGEETGNRLSDKGIWVVDPIDGTQDLLQGLPTWCMSVAYAVDGRLAFGLITNPATGDVYARPHGRGCYLERAADPRGISDEPGRRGHPIRRIRCPDDRLGGHWAVHRIRRDDHQCLGLPGGHPHRQRGGWPHQRLPRRERTRR